MTGCARGLSGDTAKVSVERTEFFIVRFYAAIAGGVASHIFDYAKIRARRGSGSMIGAIVASGGSSRQPTRWGGLQIHSFVSCWSGLYYWSHLCERGHARVRGGQLTSCSGDVRLQFAASQTALFQGLGAPGYVARRSEWLTRLRPRQSVR